MKNIVRVKNENGYALLITLLALVLITVMGLSLMTMAMNTARITKSERDNQSSYYIAEAGLVEKRAQINEIARQVFAELKAEYDVIKEPANKKNFKLEEKFKTQVQERIENSVVMTGNQTYSEQFAESPESIVTVTSNGADPLKYVITSVGMVPSEKGKTKEKTVSQTVEIKMIVPDSTETIEIPGNNTVQKFNACFAILSNQDINYFGGTVNGNIYSRNAVNVSGGKITGSVSGKSVTISNGTVGKDLISQTSVNINGGTVNGSSYGQSVSLTNGGGTVKNNIVSQSEVNISGGTVEKSVYGRSVTISGGTVNNNIVSQLDVNLNNGAVNRDVVSNRNILVQNDPRVNGNAIAKNNIIVNRDWYGGINGKYIYGNEIVYGNPNNQHNLSKDRKEKKSNISDLIASYTWPDYLTYGINDSNGCITNIPTLPLVENVFPSLNIPSTAESLKIQDSVKDLAPTDGANYNSIDLKGTLNIDLKGSDRTIYVKKLNISQGYINIINPGKLKIVVQDEFSMAGSSKINYVDEKLKNVDNVSIYFAGSKKITFNSDIRLNAHVHLKNADLYVGGSDQVNGDILAYGNSLIKFDGGSSSVDKLVLAPLGVVEVNGRVKGNIIASSVKLDWGGTVDPPTASYGEWEIPSSAPEIIEVPSYDEETTFLITDPLIQK